MVKGNAKPTPFDVVTGYPVGMSLPSQKEHTDDNNDKNNEVSEISYHGRAITLQVRTCIANSGEPG